MEMNAHNALAKPVTYKNLIHFVLPCIAMMIITSVYSIVDGFFVSNCVGKNAFAAVNLIMPVLMGVSCIGFMIGTGGTALVSYCLGAKQQERANRVFSMLVEIILIVSVVIAATCFIMMPQIVDMLGASPLIREDTIIYGRIVILNEPFFMMFIILQSFFAAAEKPPLCAVTCAHDETKGRLSPSSRPLPGDLPLKLHPSRLSAGERLSLWR